MLNIVQGIAAALRQRRIESQISYEELIARLAAGIEDQPIEKLAKILATAGKSETDLVADVELETKRIGWRADLNARDDAQREFHEFERQRAAALANHQERIAAITRETDEAIAAINVSQQRAAAIVSRGDGAWRKLTEHMTPGQRDKLAEARRQHEEAAARLREAHDIHAHACGGTNYTAALREQNMRRIADCEADCKASAERFAAAERVTIG